jgi:hypothetical protein
MKVMTYAALIILSKNCLPVLNRQDVSWAGDDIIIIAKGRGYVLNFRSPEWQFPVILKRNLCKENRGGSTAGCKASWTLGA